jgi:hypothetical protein
VMVCEQARLQFQELLDRGEKPGEELRMHLQTCEACGAYAFWLELGTRGMQQLSAASPRPEVFRGIRRLLVREGILRPWYAPARVAGVTALGAAAAAAGLIAAVHPALPHGFVEGVAARAMWIARPAWASLTELGGRLVPFGTALSRAAEPFASRVVGFPWLEASLLSLAGAAATSMMILLSVTWEKRRLGHALAL